jgi:predicted peptidase
MKRAGFAIIVSAFSVAALAFAETNPTMSQSAESFEAVVSLKYLQYVPAGYAADPTNAKSGEGHGWPLVLFLHGAGERGDNLDLVKQFGPPSLVAKGKQFPFILISPQCPKEAWWDPVVLGRLLDTIENKLKVDADRIYVTGLSMGGFGTWDLARSTPHRFAAIAPVCGGGDAGMLWIFPGMKDLPVWAFHGEKDKAVPLKRSEEMIDAVKAIGNEEAKLTVYPGVGHNSWLKAYEDPELYAWLLRHKRQASSPAARTQAATKPVR